MEATAVNRIDDIFLNIINNSFLCPQIDFTETRNTIFRCTVYSRGTGCWTAFEALLLVLLSLTSSTAYGARSGRNGNYKFYLSNLTLQTLFYNPAT
jgi:hypothetical protein